MQQANRQTYTSKSYSRILQYQIYIPTKEHLLARILPHYSISTMKSTLISILGFLSLATAAVTPRQSSLQATTDNYVFSLSISQFISNRNAQTGPAELDWSSDGCSSSPDNPFGFDCTSPFSALIQTSFYPTIPLFTNRPASSEFMLPPRLRLPQLQEAESLQRSE